MFRNVAPWMLVLVFLAISLAAVGSFLFLVLGGAEPVWGSISPLEYGPRKHSPADKIREQLNMPVNLDKGIDVSTPLKDALEFLSDRYGLTMIIDSPAFNTIGVQKSEEQPVTLPKMVGVSMRTVLRMLLAQVRGDIYCGTFIIRNDHILITTTGHVYQGEESRLDPHIPTPKIDIEASQKPLYQVLADIVDHGGVNVMIDPRVGDKASRPITATVTQIPVDSAVRLLADMAGLKMVVVDNVLYVTTPENGKQLQAEETARAEKRREMERNSLVPPPTTEPPNKEDK